MPASFRFLPLLAFKIFAAEQVDVAILEVGLGGKIDTTNVVGIRYVVILVIEYSNSAHQMVNACILLKFRFFFGLRHAHITHRKLKFRFRHRLCVASVYLPLDMTTWKFLETLLEKLPGRRLVFSSSEFQLLLCPNRMKQCVCFEDKASQLDVHPQVAVLLDINLLNGLHLGLDGEHQYINAGLAVALSSTWLQRTGRLEVNYLQQTTSLPEQFIKGLTTAALQGRSQVVPDWPIEIESPGNLVFYLDGAHSPESMEVCAKWFSLAIKDYHEPISFSNLVDDYKRASLESVRMDHHETSRKNLTQGCWHW